MGQEKYLGGTGTTRREFLAKGAAFALAAAVTGPGLTVLSGCGGSGGSASEPLTFWQPYSGGGQKGVKRWYLDLAETWNKENNTKVELRYIPTDQYQMGSQLPSAFAAGNGPDIFALSAADFLKYYNGGVLQDLSQFMEKEAINDFDYNPKFSSVRKVDGKFYNLPYEMEEMAMFYSVEAFKKAGLSEADIPKTWDQLFNVADKVKTADMFGLLFETAPGLAQNYAWYAFMWMGGGNAVAENGKESNFDSKGTIQALQFWQDAIKSGLAPRTIQGSGYGDLVANMGSGYCAIQNCGVWAVAAMKESAPDFEYGVFKLPVPPGGTYTTDNGAWGMSVNAKGKNPEEAARFAVWAVGSMSKDSIQRCTDWITKAKTDLSPRKSVMEQATKQGAFDSGPMKVFKEEVDPGSTPEPRYPPEIKKAISDALQASELSGADPKREAQQGAEKINAFLQSYSGAKIV